jgi:outer membrane protein TolC
MNIQAINALTHIVILPAIAVTAFACSSPKAFRTPPVETLQRTTAGTVFPQQNTGTTVAEDATLTDFLTIASLNHPGLRAAFEEWKASLEKEFQAKALPDPHFNYDFFIREVETRVGSQLMRVGISQSFPWFGKRKLRGTISRHAADAAWYQYEGIKRQVFHEVRKAWHELAYLHQAMRITDENIELMKHLERVAQARFRAGRDLTGVIKAQIEIGKLEEKRMHFQDLIHPLSSRLNQAMNRPATSPLPRIPLSISPDPEVSEVMLKNALEIGNPQLVSLSIEVEKQGLAVKLAKRELWPDFALGLGYIQTRAYKNMPPTARGQDPVMITGSFNIPIWNRKYQAAIRENQSLETAARLRRKEHLNRLSTDLSWSMFTLRDTERKIDLYRDTLTPLAQNALEIAEQSYQAGQSDFMELSDAQRLLFEFQLSLQQASIDRELAIADLERLVGGRILFKQLPQDRQEHQP